ncbi:hypothetical protein FACS189420_8280 [Bacteroidia bacterium]|nr:hypothetical protein FACS189420_8280 [Bacteroidia bacterium]
MTWVIGIAILAKIRYPPMPRTFIKRFQRIDKLIQRKQTGTALQLANKLEVSERTAKEFIAVMK